MKIIHPTVRDGALQFITDHNPITAHLGLNKFIPCNTIINVFADVVEIGTTIIQCRPQMDLTFSLKTKNKNNLENKLLTFFLSTVTYSVLQLVRALNYNNIMYIILYTHR